MKKLLAGLCLLSLMLLLGSCVTTGSASGRSEAPPGSGKPQPTAHELDRKEYPGVGRARGDTFLAARNQAIMDAVRKAVIDLIGAEREAASRGTLEQVLYGTGNPNAYIHTDTLESSRKEPVGDGEWVYECTVDVDLEAVRAVLEANGLYGETAAGADAAAPQGSAQAAAQGEGAQGEGAQGGRGEAEAAPSLPDGPDYGEIGEEERQFIARYVDRMTYMVYFSDQAEAEPIYSRGAVGKANEYLASRALDVVDAEQIERLKEDQQTVYQEETGQSISIIQWIAQKLNADIYVEIYGRTSGSSRPGGKHYGEASVELKAFESSTAVLMGSASYTTLEKAYSQSSQESARLNAIQAAVYKTMPRLTDQVKTNMTKWLTRGIRYEVVIQQPLGDRAMSRFWSRLEDRTRSIKMLSQSSEEVKAYVWIIGSLTDLKNTIYDITDTIAGLENMEMVLSRGKSITFNTGF